MSVLTSSIALVGCGAADLEELGADETLGVDVSAVEASIFDPMPACKTNCSGTCVDKVIKAFAAKVQANSWLGSTASNFMALPECGFFRHHVNGGTIYFHPDTGTRLVYGAIRAKWEQTGWERGPLGYPTTDETAVNDGAGHRYNFFQRGVIFWSSARGSMMVQGPAWQKWTASGEIRGTLGIPTTDELPTPDGIGRFNHFHRNASVYWTQATGANVVRDGIRDHWASLGWEWSWLGYPTSDEATGLGVLYGSFQNGYVFSSPEYGLAAGRWWFAGKYVYASPALTDSRSWMDWLNRTAISRGTVDSFRTRVLSVGLSEVAGGYRGGAALDRYDAEGEWCSEFVRAVYLWAGMKAWQLMFVTLTQDLINMFQNFGRWHTATAHNIEPGDYLALTNTAGKKKNHSAIVVAVSPDHRWIWTVEGNVDDAVYYGARDYVVDGVVNSDIDGVGKIAANMF